jgi:hypothetical protein
MTVPPTGARRLAAAAGLIAATVSAAGCAGASGEEEPVASTKRPAERSAERAADDEAPPARLEQARCPPRLTNCRSASGRILYVERIDPDGDGDAHFVLLSVQSITAPGVSVIDVSRSLRPSPLPGPGDRLSAAGPVYRGSYGQRQIEAIELHTALARR